MPRRIPLSELIPSMPYPSPNGTLTFDELLEEAMDGKSVEPSITKACVTEFMKAVKRNVLKGFRCQLGDRSASR